MKQRTSSPLVKKIMTEFAHVTGLSPASSAPRRYLWTDAFAVCNFLGLYQETGGEEFKDLVLQLVDQVHDALGRHRKDDSRTGWISGLDEEDGRLHPTKGGLRIGKQLQERRSSDPFNERLEWDRDGQYYHYLTKWMHALNRISRVTGDLKYNTWAVELAKTAHARFVDAPSYGGPKLMYWKMSIDLSLPLVPSMGQHDPLDGFVTYNELQGTAAKDPKKSTHSTPRSKGRGMLRVDTERRFLPRFKNRGLPSTRAKAQGAPSNVSMGNDLRAEIFDIANICEGRSWATDDPLGIGGLLFDACRVAQLIVNGNLEQADLLETLLESSLIGLDSFMKENSLKLPAGYRLAFRELGLSIGLQAVQKIRELIEQKSGLFRKKDSLHSVVKSLSRYAGLREIIEKFWLEGTNREADSWIAHHDINWVMLATSLAPEGFLEL